MSFGMDKYAIFFQRYIRLYRSIISKLNEMLVEGVSSKDGREKTIQLTELGKEVYKVCSRKINKLEDEVMKGIPDNEKDTLYQILPKIQSSRGVSSDVVFQNISRI